MRVEGQRPASGSPDGAVHTVLESHARLRREGGLLRDYHAVRWDEPLIMEMGSPGERGVIPPGSADLAAEVPDPLVFVPASLRRVAPPALPEISQPQLVRHYVHLSQMCLGVDATVDIGEGTCTMKYSPKVNEQLVRSPKVSELHPLQDEATLQGILAVVEGFAGICRELSGMDEVSFQPGGGSAAIFAFAAMLRKYFHERGEDGRDEVITSIFSHPANAACAATAGFKVITIMPDESGLPDLEALRASVGPRTAGLFITNPEDHGLFNPHIQTMTDLVHEAGGLCYYDQANLNGIIGVSRAREAGFDACHYNLHKTFSSPHGCKGPAAGALCVTAAMASYLPAPHVVTQSDDTVPGGVRYRLDYDRPQAIGKVRAFLGNLAVVVRAYAWALSLGPEGLREVSEVSIINNSYLERQLREIRGVSYPYAPGRFRIDQIRYSLERLQEDTGFGTFDLRTRFTDFGVQSWFMSHHPWIVPEPFTPEPCETYSKEDIDYWAAALHRSVEDAYERPDRFAAAPLAQACRRIPTWERLDDPQEWAVTWRACLRKHGRPQAAGDTGSTPGAR